MKRKLSIVLILIVFVFGLIPGDYWKLLHNHKHAKICVIEKGFSQKQKSCVSFAHLYDYTEPAKLFNTDNSEVFHIVLFKGENHLPHSSYLNLLLRAPPVC